MEMKVPEYFASMVLFDDAVMQERLPKETYRALKKTAKDGRSLDISDRKCRRKCDEGLGNRKRSHTTRIGFSR